MKKVFRLNNKEVGLALAEFLISKKKVTRTELTGKVGLYVDLEKEEIEIVLEVK